MSYYRRAVHSIHNLFTKSSKSASASASARASHGGGVNQNQSAYKQIVSQNLSSKKTPPSEYSLRSLIAALRPSFGFYNRTIIPNTNVLQNRVYNSPFTTRKPPPYYACMVVSNYVIYGSLIVAIVCSFKKETVPYTKRVRLVALTPKMEKRLGDYAFKQLIKSNKSKILPDEHPDTVRVRTVTKAVVEALLRGIKQESVWSDKRNCDSERKFIRGLKWEVIVVDEDTVNACCAPGGKIVVYTGMLKKLTTDAEIAAVIGHEITHALARHYAESLVKLVGITILLCILEEIMPSVLSDTLSEYFLELPMSRKHEIEADYIGMMLMASAGYDPKIAPTVYEELEKIDIPFEDYLFGHPSGKKRARLLAQAQVMEEALALYLDKPGHRVLEDVTVSLESLSYLPPCRGKPSN